VTATNINAFLASSLSAYTTGQQVQLYYDNTACGGLIIANGGYSGQCWVRSRRDDGWTQVYGDEYGKGSEVGPANDKTMDKYIFGIIAFAIGLTSTVGFAWSGYNNVTPTMVNVYQASQTTTPGALIQFSPGSASGSDNEGCAESGKGYAWIDWSSSVQPDGKALYTSVLAAYIAGKQIGIGINGCSSGGYPVVYGINLYP
jgi:hypothetical protein